MVPRANTDGENPGRWSSLSPTNTTRLNRPIISRYDADATEGPNNNLNDFLLQVNPEGYLVFFLGGMVDLGVLIFSRQPLESGRWYHVGVSWSVLQGQSFPQEVALRIDDWVSTLTPPQIPTSDLLTQGWKLGANRVNMPQQPIAIGKYRNDDPNWPDGQYFVGRIDEVRFWKGNRRSAFAWNANNFYSNRTVYEGRDDAWTTQTNQLMAAYNFNEGSGNVLHDQGPFGYHGTIMGGPFDDEPQWVLSSVQIITTLYIVGRTPTIIPLLGFSETGENFDYYVRWASPIFLGGQLYELSDENITDPGNFPWSSYAPTPPLGNPIIGGNPPAGVRSSSSVVYIPEPDVTGGRVFEYQIRTSTSASRWTTVRLYISCNSPGDVVDSCGVCNGNDASKDICGVCGGNGTTCVGCDGLPNGAQFDLCGECGGNNECVDCNGVVNGTAVEDRCGVCEGQNECVDCHDVPFGGAVVDDCGVCGGLNRSCGGCDGLGGVEDACGECGGNNSTCQCVVYKGYHTNELQRILVEYSVSQTLTKIEDIKFTLRVIMETLEHYTGQGDLGVMVRYFNTFSEECLAAYMDLIDSFTSQVNEHIGLA